MRAVIVYESMFGSTKKVAEAIAEGLADCAEVSVVPVTSADAHILDGADLVVVGGPTHTHGMSRPSTRKMAVKRARKPGSEVELVPGADSGPGVREWLASLGQAGGAPAPLRYPVQGIPGVHWPGVEVHPPAPRPPRGAIAASPESFLVEGLTGALVGGELGGPAPGRAPERSDCLRGVVEAPPGLLTPFAVNSATWEHRRAVSGPGDCSRRS